MPQMGWYLQRWMCGSLLTTKTHRWAVQARVGAMVDLDLAARLKAGRLVEPMVDPTVEQTRSVMRTVPQSL